MSSKAMRLKGKIKNYAKQHNIAAQVVLQNYMFERLLERLSLSEFNNKFIIKGGVLVAAIVGLDVRSTMDLDTTLRNLPLTPDQLEKAIHSIISIELNDNVHFEVKSIEPIRKEDIYGGYCIRLDAIFDSIVTPLSIDVSTGDVITPNALQYEMNGIFNEDLKINLWGYNIETILAEKVQTILSRSVFSTRPKDFYDIYILATTQTYSPKTFVEAFVATTAHRETIDISSNSIEIFNTISASNSLRISWTKYQQKFPYAKEIQYDDILTILKTLITHLN